MINPFALDVLLHGTSIGTITLLDGERTILSFADTYVTNVDRPILSLGFKDVHGELITEHRTYQTRLMPFFSNLLPEGPLRRYLAALAGVKSQREFFLLWALGKDLPGAVTVQASEPSHWPPRILSSDTPQNDQNRQVDLLRFSLAGVQLKFSAVRESHGGLTIPAEGIGGSWIVKLPSAQYAHVPENEFSMMTLARQVGIDVPEFDLIELNKITNIPSGIDQIGETAFIIRRFDRDEDGHAVHIEDFAQVFGVWPEDKYDRASARNIADVIASECGMADSAEFVRRLVFNTLIGNADMHLKNWSLIYPDQRKARIAPAYDFVATVPYIPDDKAALKVSRSAKFCDFTLEELTHLAEKARLPERLVLDTARETVGRFREVWDQEKKHLPMSSGVLRSIENHLKSLPLFGQLGISQRG